MQLRIILLFLYDHQHSTVALLYYTLFVVLISNVAAEGDHGQFFKGGHFGPGGHQAKATIDFSVLNKT